MGLIRAGVTREARQHSSFIIPLTTQDRAQQKYESINNDKIDDKEENDKIDIFKIG